MKRTLIGLICPIGLGGARIAIAEGVDGGVLLRYQFKPGDELRYRVTMHGDMTTTTGVVTSSARAAAPGTVPTSVNGSYELVEKVIAVSPGGVASVSVGLVKMETVTSVTGMRVIVGLGASGKLEMRMNGQSMGSPNTPNTHPRPLYEMKLDPTGRISMVSPDSPDTMIRLLAGENVAVMLNSCLPGMGMPMLPEKPVNAGDTWESRQEVQIPLPMPVLAGGGPDDGAPGTPLTLKAAFHNNLLRVENGRAVIETQVTATAMPGARPPLPRGAAAPCGTAMAVDPGDQSMAVVCANGEIVPLGAVGAFERMDESMSSTESFYIAQGIIEGGSSEMNVTVVPAMGPPLRASVGGTIMTKVERLTTSPAAGAP